ncbi:hypothetical protein J7E88_10535 [Streptomyces sp. ISL-10]|uniref:hypothetical protein n=1 Tax=Streptomyces sp. ISL-10 TaxID=2819172 RepID=UPI001BEC25E4|nr:hypothetical protein [Streptomyces sp. ISL-10]MBT2365738.1 hypothetical protein [Streptomyces sp. ISL-10]
MRGREDLPQAVDRSRHRPLPGQRVGHLAHIEDPGFPRPDWLDATTGPGSLSATPGRWAAVAAAGPGQE